MYFLGIEIGHAATRVVALDLESATVVAEGAGAHEWLEGLPEGHREQDPGMWIGALRKAMHEVVGGLGDGRGGVVSMGLTAPAGGMVVLDGADRVVRPAKLGCDRSARRQVEEIGRVFGGAPGMIELTGNPLDAGQLAAQVLWLKQHEPAHFKRAVRVMTVQDFIGYWLTGEPGTTAATAAATGLFAVPERRWCGELLECIDGRLEGMLSPGIRPGRPRGLLRAALAAEWGLAAEVLVAGGAVAGAAAVFSAGAALPGEMVADFSAEGALAAISAAAVVDFRGEGTVGCEVGGNLFTRMGMSNVVAAPELVRRHYGWSAAEAEAAVAAADPGADGLLFLPYLRGEAAPRLPEGTGVLHGLSMDNFTPGNLVRAAAEGVALGFGYAMSRLRDLGFEPSVVRLTRDAGPAMNQLLADALGVGVVAVSGGGGALTGALMEAAVVYFRQHGEELGFDEIAGYIVTVDEATRRQPDEERREFYEGLLARQQYLAETLHAGGFL